MKTLSKLYTLLILLTAPTILKAQDRIPQYPIRFTQFYNAYSIINPAWAGTYARLEMVLGNQRMLGNLSKVSTYFLNVNYRINRQILSQKPFSTIGITLYNDREGKYLNRTRFYALYAWHGTIRGNLRISGGLQIGGMNYSVKGTPLTGDGSDIKPDASVGIQLYNQVFHAGFSVNQVFNSEVRPLEEITVLAPYATVAADIWLKTTEWLVISPALSFQFPLTGEDSRYSKNLFDIVLLFKFQEKFSISSGIHNNDRIAITAGIDNLLQSTGNLHVYLSYSFVFRKNTNLSSPLFEIGISYFF